MTVRLHDAEGFKRAGGAAVLTLPPTFRGPGAGVTMTLRELSMADSARKYPIDASKVLTVGEHATDFRLTLPEGWKAQLPKGIVAKSDFGDYTSEFSQQGRVLHIAFKTQGRGGVFPKERLADLRAWLKSVSEDAVESIVLVPPPTP